MDKVKVHKSELLEALQENRDAHQGIFNEAVAGYKAEAEKQRKQHLKDVQSGKMKVVQVWLPVPENHTKDYERIIAMVEMSVDEEIELSQAQFAQFVMDDWSWKQQFLTTNSTYSSTAAASLS